MNEVLDILGRTFRLGGPLALAAMGGLLSERSGVVNIALEGNMVGAACAGAMASAATGNPLLGVAVGILAGVVLSLVHGVATHAFRVDHIVSGMAVNAIALGVTGFAAKLAANRGIEQHFDSLPQSLFITLALAAPIAIHYWIHNTRGGLRLSAVGNDPAKAIESGVNAASTRWFALVGCGVLCGLAGSMLVSQPEQFSSGMTAGKGFIALAALILGSWRPIPTLVAALVFGFLDALQLKFQGTPLFGVDVPSQVWASLPYVMTLIALAGLLGRSRPPAALGARVEHQG